MIGRLPTFAAVLCSLFAHSAGAQNTGLTRLTDRDDLLGWEAVGRLDQEGVGFCTGTLIAPDLVLTAAHCVYHPQTSEPVAASDLIFRAGLRDGTSIAERSVLQIAAHSSFDPDGALDADNIRHDVALLRLEQPILSSDANPFILHTGTMAESRVSVVSYGEGRAQALSRQRRCEIVATYEHIMTFDCNVTFGSSGAPVFAHTGNRGRIVSVISATTQVEGQQVSVGMKLTKIVAELKRTLRANAPRPVAVVRKWAADGNKSGTGAKFVKSRKP